ncbi:hypothetical protein Tco_0171008 [Tanacetum coccineum]
MTLFAETELRLGLPGGGGNKNVEGGATTVHNPGKRGYDETIMDLKLKLSSSDQETKIDHEKKHASANPPAK